MNISLILAHPSKGSFNAAIATCCNDTLVANGHTAFFHDLYAEKFDALLPAAEIPKTAVLSDSLQRHCDELASADGIIVVHPNWWGQPPAILKGWIDRVIRPGVAYKFVEGDSGEGIPVGLLNAQSALVFNTGDTALDRETSLFMDPLETIWKNCIFGLCGVRHFHRKLFSIVVTSTEEQRKNWLLDVSETVNRYYPKEIPTA